ncbi:Agamous-like mads-box protein agl62 [Thalictrum thalictroides]|uniref:Agamous-like mads-box protein agl62 n=1 Tax=Thalictrum thalictroides TaxID=46969 RepID=A0A7J6VGQ0_THATH|nr:Agamous-like mads-box protein agl62 [Thalictrum thalictroides]
MGRRRIEIKKIEDKKRLNVTFSKRRSGLFSKAQDLSNRSGDQVGIIVFSQSGKLYTFGQPGLDSILDRYLQERGGSAVAGVGTSADNKKPVLDNNYDDGDNGLEAESRRGGGIRDLLMKKRSFDSNDHERDHQFIIPRETMKPCGGGMGAEILKKKNPVLINDDGVNGLEAESKRGGGIRDFLSSFDSKAHNEMDHQFINPREIILSLEEVEMLKKKKKKKMTLQ